MTKTEARKLAVRARTNLSLASLYLRPDIQELHPGWRDIRLDLLTRAQADVSALFDDAYLSSGRGMPRAYDGSNDMFEEGI